MGHGAMAGEPEGYEAALAALVGSGLDTSRFAVVREVSDAVACDPTMTRVVRVRAGARSDAIEELSPEGPVVWVGDPPEAEWWRGTAGELSTGASEGPPTGGWLVIGPTAPAEVDDARLTEEVQRLRRDGESTSAAARTVARRFGVPKRRVYELALGLERGD